MGHVLIGTIHASYETQRTLVSMSLVWVKQCTSCIFIDYYYPELHRKCETMRTYTTVTCEASEISHMF